MCRKTYFLIGVIVAAGVMSQAGPSAAATLSGRVYEGSVGDENKPLGGVSVTLYGSNNSGQQGTYITSTTTSPDGWYGLEAEGAFDYFNIVESDPSGYTSTGASSVGGSVLGDNWIQYDFLGLSGTTTGNKFWDRKEGGGPPTNSPPVAVDDAYGVSAGGVLNTAAPGVLGNDSDADGDPLTAIQVSGPSQGTLVLNPNGSFTYTPNPGSSGTDSFTYKANDGLLDSNVATVTIRVDPGTEPPQGYGILDGYKRDADTGTGLENWRIYIDLNGNGQWDPGEPSDLTDGNGYYRIADVEPGTYRVCEQMQMGWEAVHPCVDGVTVVGGVVTTQDFHNRRTGSPDGTGAIRGTKFNDLNSNGQRDPGEPGLWGWRIVLQDTDGNVLATTTTDANGDYAFIDLEAGPYEVDEVQQSGWRQTYPEIDGEPAVWVIGLEPEGVVDEIDFGNQRTGEPAGGQVDVFGMCLRLEMEIPGIGLVRASLSGPAKTRIQVGSGGQASDTNGNGRDDVPAELVDLALTGMDPMVGTVMMRLNADKPSIGQIEERINNTSSILDVPPYVATGTADSFFDIWIEIQLPDLGLCFRTSGSVRLAGVISHVPPLASGAYAANLQTPAGLFKGPCGGPWPATVGPAEAFIRSLTSCQGGPPGDPGQGSVTIVKRATPADDTTFQICANFAPGGFFDVLCWSLQAPSHPQESVSAQDLPLLRSVRETPLPGWTLRDVTVTGDTDQGSTVDLSRGTVELDYDPGENIVIIFENEKVSAGGLDYGDAPLSYGDAWHTVDKRLTMGSLIDAENAAKHSAAADGDDVHDMDDEDGVTFSASLARGKQVEVCVEIHNGVSAATRVVVAGWIDFDGDGQWGLSAEQLFTRPVYLPPLSIVKECVQVTIPQDATPSTTFARFRLFRDPTVPGVDFAALPTGDGGDGEVEDYQVVIQPEGDVPPPGSLITGIKFNDLDGDGVWEPADGELRLPNWTIWLDEDNDGTPDRITKTDSQGGFDFAGLSPGTYTVGEEQQPGWTQTAPQAPGTFSVTITGGAQPTAHFLMFGNRQERGRDYGDAPLPYPEASHLLGGPYLGLFGDAPDSEPGMQRDILASGDDSDIGGDDENGLLSINLVKTPGAWSTWELKGYFGPSSDAMFGLWIDLNSDGDWNDPNELRAMFGFCGFGSSPQDWFHATGAFKLPAQAQAGRTYARLRVYGDCNATVSPSGAGGPGEVEDHLVEIKAGGAGVPPGGIVHGYKWNDINGSGLWDILNPGEPPLAGWTIWLDTNNSGRQDAGDMTTQTDAQGHFRFAGVPAGTYTLGEQLQPGWTQTTPGGPGTYSVTVQPGQASLPQMFGNRQSGGPTANGRIYGSKWNDLNGDGTPDAVEPPLANWKIYLDLNQNGRWDTGEPSDLTDASGSFEFTGLAAGSYTVAEQMQPGWQQTWPGGAGTHTISIQPGTQAASVVFGNTTRLVPPPPDGLKKLDWGDAPDPMYPTLRVSNGAYHVIVPGFHLGAAIDGEPDGQPTPDALGDDHFDADDEDGVTFLTPILPGGVAGVEITASAAGSVDAWLDCDGDGTWNQPGEQILASEPVAAGSTVLSVVIPASAQLNLATFARFRLSRTGGLSPTGPAQDGEVEDYHVLISPEGPGVPGTGERPHLKWSQPPVEIDPNADAPPVFCGWNEAARSTQYAGTKRQWRMDADDFRCLGPLPVTRIRWWGGYEGRGSPEPPDSQPEAWHIGFWANQVPGLAPDKLFLERLVWSIEVPNERVHQEPAGMTEFSQAFPEMCFVYEVGLEPQEWFHQREFASNAGVFWISITAIYPPDAEARNQWGWTTRPCVWRDGAVTPAIMDEWPTPEERLFPGRIIPIERSTLCGQSQAFDLCFELLTEEPWVKWDQPFTGVRNWPDYEDIESHGISIRQEESIGPVVADDWPCQRDTPVIAAAWWGSYIGYGYEPCRCDTRPRPPKPDYFLLQMRTGPSEMPGDVIWEYRAHDCDEVLVGYDRRPEGEPNEPVFRYSVRLPEERWFRQSAADGRYWFSVTAVYTDPLPMIVYPWGWTNHPHRFGSGASFIDYRADPRPEWRPIHDPQDRPADMSFTLFTLPEGRPEPIEP